MKAKLPENEEARLEDLRSFEILDTLPEQAYDDITFLASQICGTPIALVSLIDEDRQWFKSKIGLDGTQGPRDMAFCAHAILQRDLFVVPDATIDVRFSDNPLVVEAPQIRFYAGAPLISPDGHQLGTLCAIDRIPRQLSHDQEASLEALSRQVVAQMELKRQNFRQTQTLNELTKTQSELEMNRTRLEQANSVLENLSVTDELTGLSNRRAFNERLRFEIKRAGRHGTPLSLLILDVDKFKSYNDTFGHPEGDTVLRTIGQLLASKGRDTDLVARYGGEEFVVVLPDAAESAASMLAERLRCAIEQIKGLKRGVTASFGVATLTSELTEGTALLAAADKALYFSKEQGRNRVTHIRDL